MFDGGTLTPAKEDYLKALLMLSKNDGVRTSDIARRLDVSKASVSKMMEVLMADGLVLKKKYGRIYLTEYGRDAAEYVKNKHDALKNYMVCVLGLDRETADRDACRMEHAISMETARKLQNLCQAGCE